MMKRNLFLMGALALAVAGGIFWSCQKEELIDDALILKGGTIPFTWIDVCANGTNDLVLTLVGEGNRQIQQLIGSDWVQIAQVNGGSDPLLGILSKVTAGTYSFRYKLDKGGFTDPIVIEIESCCTTALTGVSACDEVTIDEVTYNRKAVYTFSTEDGGLFKIQGGLTNFTGTDYLLETTVGTIDSRIPGNSSNRVVTAEGSLDECETVEVTVYWNSTNEDEYITGDWSVELNGEKILVIDQLMCDDEGVGEEYVDLTEE